MGPIKTYNISDADDALDMIADLLEEYGVSDFTYMLTAELDYSHGEPETAIEILEECIADHEEDPWASHK